MNIYKYFKFSNLFKNVRESPLILFLLKLLYLKHKFIYGKIYIYMYIKLKNK